MSDYRVTVTVPVELADTASAVGRAMDIDVGGHNSFTPVFPGLDENGQPTGMPTSLQAQTWASEAFAQMFQYLIASPQGLHMAVAADYESRWPGLEPPDLPAITAFCQAASMTIDPPLA